MWENQQTRGTNVGNQQTRGTMAKIDAISREAADKSDSLSLLTFSFCFVYYVVDIHIHTAIKLRVYLGMTHCIIIHSQTGQKTGILYAFFITYC